jgi:hypothetical protein
VGYGLYYRYAPGEPEFGGAFAELVADARRCVTDAPRHDLHAYVGIWPDAIDVATNEVWRWKPGQGFEPVLLLADPTRYLSILGEHEIDHWADDESALLGDIPAGWGWIESSPKTNDFPYEAIGGSLLLRAAELAPASFCLRTSEAEWDREWTETNYHKAGDDIEFIGARGFYESVFGERPDPAIVCFWGSCRHEEAIKASGPVLEDFRIGKALAAARLRRHIRHIDLDADRHGPEDDRVVVRI